MENQQKILGDIIGKMVKLDFAHLAILSVNLSDHQFNILQQAEMNRLKQCENVN